MTRRRRWAMLIAALAIPSLSPSALTAQGNASTMPMRVLVPAVVLVGGSTLEAHLGRVDALREINKVKWDFVVLQEQSTRPLDAPASLWRRCGVAVASLWRRCGIAVASLWHRCGIAVASPQRLAWSATRP